MASKKLRDAAENIKKLLGDYDAVHVHRGDKLKTRKDRYGVDRSLHPHLDRDTCAEFILCRISKWVPPGRTLFIVSNERTPGFFSPLSVRYKLAYSSNYSSTLDPLIENNYLLFMLERLIMMGAKKFIRTFNEETIQISALLTPQRRIQRYGKYLFIPGLEKSADMISYGSVPNLSGVTLSIMFTHCGWNFLGDYILLQHRRTRKSSLQIRILSGLHVYFPCNVREVAPFSPIVYYAVEFQQRILIFLGIYDVYRNV